MNKLYKIGKSLGGLVSLLAAWQLVIYIWQPPTYILPSPYNVYSAIIEQYPILLKELIPTIIEIAIGLIIGITVGLVLGIITAYSRIIKYGLLPLLLVSQAIPIFVIAPILVIWFGYGIVAKIIICTLIVLFPVASSTYDGLQQTPKDWLILAHNLNAKPLGLFWQIRFPAALPKIASGIKIAATAAPLGAIIGEWVGSSQGLGYLMLNANAKMDIPLMFSATILLIFITLILYYMVNAIFKKIIWWV